jgi:hypothetical protein
MTMLKQAARGAAVMFLVTSAACSSTGGLGSILGGVLGGQNDVNGTVQNIDSRRQEISLRESNGQTIVIGYDNRTQVVYQNQTYSVSSLEYGDDVTARLSSGNSSNNYYTDHIQVNRSVNGNTGGGVSGNVQTITGNVRQVDYANGWFTLNTGNYGTVTVSMPYNPSRADLSRFQNLRNGDSVRLYGVFLNNTRVELRQFY